MSPYPTTLVSRCPWCDAVESSPWGNPLRDFYAHQCARCSLIYIKNRLSDLGLTQFYIDYYSNIHQADETLNRQREQMYQLEIDLIRPWIPAGRVLDVGCSGGQFLDLFAAAGYHCHGVEYGETASREAAKKYPIHFGHFPELPITDIFDLIIFRGVIEHVTHPKQYLLKAHELLSPNGCIYITSTPDADAFCCRLYRENWNQHIPEEHICHFSTKHFTDFYTSLGYHHLITRHFYEETPYAEPEHDILKVAKAIQSVKSGSPTPSRSPAFWGNMMTLAFRKPGTR